MFKPGDKVRPNETYNNDLDKWHGYFHIPFGTYTVECISGKSFSLKEYPDKSLVWSESCWELVSQEEQVRKLLSKLDEEQAETNLENINK